MLASLRILKPWLSGWVLASVLLLTCSIPRSAQAALVINADLTNLADVVLGQDLWQGSYSLSGASFLANEGFTVYFDSALYSGLSAPLPPVPPNWDVLTIQPDSILAAPGFLDGLALVNSPPLNQPFLLNFVWRGAGAPGTQPLETYSLAGGFHITGSGQTVVSAIPEVGFGFGTGIAVLTAVGLSGARGRHGRKRGVASR